MPEERFGKLPITLHSKKVQRGSIFVAIQGACDDGARYIIEAVHNGACEIVVADSVTLDECTLKVCANYKVHITYVANPRKALAERAAHVHGYPAQKLHCIGITGTKGKTTTAWITYHLLTQAGYRTALLSTVENRIGTKKYTTELTTQQPDYLQAFFRACVEEGITHVVIEVAAQALTHYRVYGIPFSEVAWLNFSQEHGEFYNSEDDYWSAKLSLLEQVVPGGTIVIPHDDTRFEKLRVREDVTYRTWSYKDIPVNVGTQQNVYVACRYEHEAVRCPHLLGVHNGANLLVALMLTHAAGVAPGIMNRALENFPGVPGRLNWYTLPHGARVCIDYAHNPASFEATLSSLREHTSNLIVVFGSGGERDAARRPVMGAIAARYADLVILTTDNPRSEDPQVICTHILGGVQPSLASKVIVELDRAQAIREACDRSSEGAIIALLGKGVEEYQLIQGKKHFFSDRAIIESARRG